jgi:DNA-binding transcriptional MerR regulator
MITVSKTQKRDFSNVFDVADELGVSVTSLKNWELFLELDIKRNQKGARIYTRSNIDDLKKIKNLLKDGKTLKELKDAWGQLKVSNSETEEEPHIEVLTEENNAKDNQFELVVINKYESRIIELTNKQENLHRQLGRLEGELSKYNDIIRLKDSQLKDKESIIADLKDRLQKQESRKWWQIWK